LYPNKCHIVNAKIVRNGKKPASSGSGSTTGVTALTFKEAGAAGSFSLVFFLTAKKESNA